MSFNREKPPTEEAEEKYAFDPQEDITAYELAQLLPLLTVAWKDLSVYPIIGAKLIPPNRNHYIEELPDNLRRHFRLINPANSQAADS